MNRPALLALLILPLLARAGALEEYCQAQFSAGQHNAQAVHAALLERVATVSTNPVARAKGLIDDELALEALILTGPNPLITSNDWQAIALDARAGQVARKLDNRLIQANTADKALAALVLGAKIHALEDRIVRRSYVPYGALAGQPTEPTVVTTRGQVQWRALGLPRPPTLPEVRAALRPPPAP